MKRAICLGSVFALLAVCPQLVNACTCGRGRADGEFNVELYKRWWLEAFAGIVFRGEVIKIEKVKVKEPWGRQEKFRVTFKVERYWKSNGKSLAVVFTNTGCCACGVRYRKGETYFINAQYLNDLPQTDICTAFTDEDVDFFIKALGEGKTPEDKELP